MECKWKRHSLEMEKNKRNLYAVSIFLHSLLVYFPSTLFTCCVAFLFCYRSLRMLHKAQIYFRFRLQPSAFPLHMYRTRKRRIMSIGRGVQRQNLESHGKAVETDLMGWWKSKNNFRSCYHSGCFYSLNARICLCLQIDSLRSSCDARAKSSILWIRTALEYTQFRIRRKYLYARVRERDTLKRSFKSFGIKGWQSQYSEHWMLFFFSYIANNKNISIEWHKVWGVSSRFPFHLFGRFGLFKEKHGPGLIIHQTRDFRKWNLDEDVLHELCSNKRHYTNWKWGNLWPEAVTKWA